MIKTSAIYLGKKKVGSAKFIRFGKPCFSTIFDEFFIDSTGQIYVHKCWSSSKPKIKGCGYYLEGNLSFSNLSYGGYPRFDRYLKAQQMNLEEFVLFSQNFNMKELPYV